jgi:hypothetical protein
MTKRDKTGTPNSPGSHIRTLAAKYARDALDMLFELAQGAESEAVRVSAIKELLDRGIGKSGAPDPDAPILTRIERVIVHPKN